MGGGPEIAMRYRRLPSVLLPLLIAGCAGRPHQAVVVAAPPAPIVAVVPLPTGASPGMLVPQPLADGSFPTPNQQLSAAGALWHLRAGLNVAALSCPGEEGAAIRAGYNSWLRRDKLVLARAVKTYAAEYHVQTPAGRVAYDDAMTRLYNFFSQTPVRPAFCATAARLTAQMTGAAATMAVSDRLATLDAPFVDFYRAYDAWRGNRPLSVIAAAAVTSPGPAPAAPTARPRLVLDLASLPPDDALAAR